MGPARHLRRALMGVDRARGGWRGGALQLLRQAGAEGARIVARADGAVNTTASTPNCQHPTPNLGSQLGVGNWELELHEPDLPCGPNSSELQHHDGDGDSRDAAGP